MFNQDRVDIEQVICPPYDLITPEEQENFYRSSPHNIIRLVLGKDAPGDSESNSKYTRAAAFLKKWIDDGLLIRDDRPSIYVYGFGYELENVTKQVLGFISLVKLADFDSGVVLPHENTFAGPKRDRLKLMQSVSANLDQVYSVFSDKTGAIRSFLSKETKKRPAISVDSFQGVSHQIWAVRDRDTISAITSILADQSLYIADGHHRYETAIEYAKWRREGADGEESFNYIPMLLVDIANEPLDVLPTHRIVHDLLMPEDAFLKRLRENFELKEYGSLERLKEGLTSLPNKHAFGLYTESKKCYLVILKDESAINGSMPAGVSDDWKGLDAAVVQYMVLKDILGIDGDRGEKSPRLSFTDGYREAADLVDGKEAKAAILMRATKIDQVKAIAMNNEKMPQKSTYFYPKPVTGLIINLID